MKVAQLPRLVVDALGGPRELPESWGVHLAQAIETPEMSERCVQAARKIAAAAARPPVHEVYRLLLDSVSSQRKVKASAQDRVIKDEGGTSLFRIRSRSDAIAVIVPLRGVSPQTFQEIASAIEKALYS
jgi:hypothetical protein